MKKTNLKLKEMKEIVIFRGPKGDVTLQGDADKETIWATLDQIASVFGRDKSVISRHFTNIFKEGELEKISVVAKNATTAADGKVYQVEYYNLDAIISVGYRVNSKTATQFRQWATSVLRQHITKGFTINRSQIGSHHDEFMQVVGTLKTVVPASSGVDAASVLALVEQFADTWFSLDAYDKAALLPGKVSKKKVKLTADDLVSSICILKTELIRKGEATENFAQERNRGAVEGIVGNTMQSFGGKEMYQSIESKAAHLLYFIIKNHPFVDGNKRTGAYAFVWFLRRAGALDRSRLNPTTLTALTLLIAQSDPADKEKMTDLVVMLLTGPGKIK